MKKTTGISPLQFVLLKSCVGLLPNAIGIWIMIAYSQSFDAFHYAGPDRGSNLWAYLLTALILAIIIALDIRFSARVLRLLGKRRRDSIRPDELLTLKQHVLSIPLFSTRLSLLGWGGAGLCVPASSLLTGGSSLEALLLFLRILVAGGSIAVTITFFMADSLNRLLVPRLFPEGKLDQVKNPSQVPLFVRMMVAFWIGGILPLLIYLYFSQRYIMLQASGALPPQMPNQFRLLTLLVLLLSVFMSLLSTFYFSRTLTRPLLGLKKGMGKLQEGNFGLSLQEVEPDEVGIVIAGFNTMSRKLRQSYSALERERNQLDARVRERTAELEQAYQALHQAHRELQQKTRVIAEDLYLARSLQTGFLYADHDRYQGIQVGIHFQPMIEVGGDIYDISEISDGLFRVFLADATGHGVQAALITMIIKTEYDALKMKDVPPNELLHIFNRLFFRKYYKLSMFFTCIIADINTKQGLIRYSAAGHPHQHVVTGKHVLPLAGRGKMVGLLDEMEYGLYEERFDKADRLLLFTDGLFEVFSEEGEVFGEQRLEACFLDHRHKEMDSMVQAVIADVERWRGNTPINDDITLIGIEMGERP